MWGGKGEGEVKVVEQQIGALGNPCSSFSSSSSLLCIRRGFDKNFTLGSAVHIICLFKNELKMLYSNLNFQKHLLKKITLKTVAKAVYSIPTTKKGYLKKFNLTPFFHCSLANQL